MLSRDDYIELVEQDYFGNVADPDLEAVLACFTDDARAAVYHGDDPVQIYARRPRAGESPLEAYFEYVFATFDVEYEGFEHWVDVEQERCACTFVVYLTGKPGTELARAGRGKYQNANFFQCRGGKFAEVVIYYANPPA
jgi:ketosteroid isomerase-like protein